MLIPLSAVKFHFTNFGEGVLYRVNQLRFLVPLAVFFSGCSVTRSESLSATTNTSLTTAKPLHEELETSSADYSGVDLKILEEINHGGELYLRAQIEAPAEFSEDNSDVVASQIRDGVKVEEFRWPLKDIIDHSAKVAKLGGDVKNAADDSQGSKGKRIPLFFHIPVAGATDYQIRLSWRNSPQPALSEQAAGTSGEQPPLKLGESNNSLHLEDQAKRIVVSDVKIAVDSSCDRGACQERNRLSCLITNRDDKVLPAAMLTIRFVESESDGQGNSNELRQGVRLNNLNLLPGQSRALSIKLPEEWSIAGREPILEIVPLS